MKEKCIIFLQLCKKDETIRELTMCIDETQHQYNECFTEVRNILYIYIN